MEHSVSQRRPVRRAISLSLAAGSGRTWPGQKAVALAGTKRNQPRNQAKTLIFFKDLVHFDGSGACRNQWNQPRNQAKR